MIEMCKDLSDERLNGTENHSSNPSLLRQSSAFQKKMPFKQSDSSREDFELFRPSLEIDFVPFNITLAQKIAHCFLERIFGG